MDSITLRYTSSGTTYEQDFDVLTVKGLDEPDRWIMVGTQHEARDGSIIEQVRGILRVIDADLGSVTDQNLQNFLQKFIDSTTREVEYNGLIALTVLKEPKQFANVYQNGFGRSKHYVLSLVDKNIQRTFGRQIVEGELAYIKRHVQITGTLDSPQTLTTNTSPLATDQTGAAYPTFSDSTHVYTVIVDGSAYQEAKIVLVTQPSVSGGNITFQVGIGYSGNASGDGNYYADIVIILQAK